jgi:phage gp29-like protein
MPSEQTPKVRDLKEEVGRPSVRSIRSPYRSSQAAGLTPARLGRLVRAADEGDTDAFFTLAAEVEQREPHYRSVLTARKQAVSGEEFHIAAASDKRADQKIADFCRSLIADPIFEPLVFDVLDSLSKGISFTEIIWDTQGSEWRPCRYEWREQRHFAWDEDTLSIPLLKTDAHPMGEPLAPYKWIVHAPKLLSGAPYQSGLARTAMAIWMFKSLTIRDWLAFQEQYGMPIRVGKYPTGATPEQRTALELAITNIGADSGCTIPDTMLIEFLERKAGGGSDKLYQGSADYWNGELSKLVLGQTMTTEDGSSLGQAAVHERKEMTVNRADSRSACAAIARDMLTAAVRLNFGPDAAVPRLFQPMRSPVEQAAFMANVTAFVELGGEVEESVVRDALGLPDPPKPKKGEEPPRLLKRAAPVAPVAPVDPKTPEEPPPEETP